MSAFSAGSFAPDHESSTYRTGIAVFLLSDPGFNSDLSLSCDKFHDVFVMTDPVHHMNMVRSWFSHPMIFPQ